MASGSIGLTAITPESRGLIIEMTNAHPNALDINENEQEFVSTNFQRQTRIKSFWMASLEGST